MIHWTVDPNAGKAWFGGPWDSALPIPVGYATEGLDENHVHTRMYEVYLAQVGPARLQPNRSRAGARKQGTKRKSALDGRPEGARPLAGAWGCPVMYQ